MTIQQPSEPTKWTLLPPAPNVCQQCAMDHDPEFPHNQQSLFWKYWFYSENGRWPTWKDAMDHCSDQMKEHWIHALKKHGIEVEGDEDGTEKNDND